MECDSIDTWRREIAEPLWDADVKLAHRHGPAEPVKVALECMPLGQSLLSDLRVETGRSVVARDPARVAASARPFVFGLSVVRRGRALISIGGEQAVLCAGDLCLVSSAVPFTKQLSNTYEEILYLAPAANIEPELCVDPERLAVCRNSHGLGRLLACHVTSVAAHARNLHQQTTGQLAASHLEASTNHILAAVFGGADSATTSELRARTIREAQRDRVLEVIARHFRDPDLDPPKIARHCRISLRYLHALFAGEESVSSRLLAYRLEHCRSVLASVGPDTQRLSIAELAYASGFNSASHFCRTFKARFGTTPRAARGG